MLLIRDCKRVIAALLKGPTCPCVILIIIAMEYVDILTRENLSSIHCGVFIGQFYHLVGGEGMW